VLCYNSAVPELLPSMHLIVNPTAGRGAARRALPCIETYLQRHGVAFTTTITTERGHAELIAEAALAKGNQTVVAVGGDGTLHEVSNAVIQTDPALQPTLGLIACGTGNDFARCVGIYGDIAFMCSILIHGERRFVDIGSVESHDLPRRSFLVAAGVGYIADTALTVNKGIRYLSGMPAYILAAVLTLSSFKPLPITLKIDHNEVRNVNAMLVSVSNVETTGGGMKIAPKALFDDGLLDICLVHEVSKLELLKQLPNVIKGLHVDHPAVEMIHTKSITISSSEHLALWVDGEVIGTTPAKFSVETKMLPIMLAKSVRTIEN
jgi:diacylglycerol kinase (ATP)